MFLIRIFKKKRKVAPIYGLATSLLVLQIASNSQISVSLKNVQGFLNLFAMLKS